MPIKGANTSEKMMESATQIEASDLILAYLATLDVEYIFGIPGGAIEPLFNAHRTQRPQKRTKACGRTTRNQRRVYG